MRSDWKLPLASSRAQVARRRTDTFAYALRPDAMFARSGVAAQHVHRLVVQTFTFIGVSVTNVLACNSPGAPAISDQERKRRIAASQKLQSYAIFASACCGVACTAGCLIFSRPLLRLMGANEELLPLSLPYLRIRCLAAPAVMIMNACQGAFLGQQNTVTPLAIFVAAAVCNATMGVTFVLGFGWGLQGAATATAIVQVRCRHGLSVQRATALVLQQWVQRARAIWLRARDSTEAALHAPFAASGSSDDSLIENLYPSHRARLASGVRRAAVYNSHSVPVGAGKAWRQQQGHPPGVGGPAERPRPRPLHGRGLEAADSDALQDGGIRVDLGCCDNAGQEVDRVAPGAAWLSAERRLAQATIYQNSASASIQLRSAVQHSSIAGNLLKPSKR